MHQSAYRAERELPLKSQPNVDQHNGNGDNDRENSRFYQLAGDFRPHRLHGRKANIWSNIAQGGFELRH